MDEFDAVDIVFDAVSHAHIGGVTIYKDRSESGVTCEHIIINHLDLNELYLVNKIPVNVNILVPLKPNGMYSRQRMKELKRKIRTSINSINSNDGRCKEVEVIWSEPLPGYKEGFQCINIRLEILLDQ